MAVITSMMSSSGGEGGGGYFIGLVLGLFALSYPVLTWLNIVSGPAQSPASSTDRPAGVALGSALPQLVADHGTLDLGRPLPDPAYAELARRSTGCSRM